MKQSLSEKIALLPEQPGCYLMKNKFKDIIYVGKAKNLKNRVSSYFTGAHDHKTTKMVSQVADFDIIITSTEKESLILEINLIKEHRPKFNIIFMDDKSYPYLKLNREGIPKVVVSRDKKQDPKFYYFGPYPDATAARNMASVLNESLPEQGEFNPNTKAIYSKFNREALSFTDAELDQWRQNLVRLLNGNGDDFLKSLKAQMYQASEDLNFELAQVLKEKIEAVKYISDKQKVQFPAYESFDLFNYAYYQGYIAIVGFFVRNGRLLERSMAIEACMEEPSDALFSFVAQFYENQPVAKKIYVPQSLDAEALSQLIEGEVIYAYRGKKRHLLDLAEKNAKNQLEDQFSILRKRQSFKEQALADLQTALSIDSMIERIEIFDISHISGSYTVASCVVYDQGEPNKNEYRRYRLNVENDDVKSMKEVLYRRYFRLLMEQKTMPDLVVVDGGLPQLNAALEVFSELRLNLNLISLVKDDRHRTEAILNSQGDRIEIKANSDLFALLAQMQDEVHRFAITYHRKLRSKAMTRSILDEVSGLGEVRKKKLYKEFKSLKGMRAQSVASLAQVVPEKVAQELYEVLHLDWSEQDD